MLTIFSWMPFFVPAIVALVVVLTNQDRPAVEENIDNWDNGLTW